MTSLLPTPEPPDPVEGALGHFEHSNWVKQALKNLDEGTVHSNGGVATGTLLADQVTIDNPEDQTARLNLKGNITKSVLGKTSDDLSRWELVLGDNTSEGGGNSGSLFKLLAYSDAGSLLQTVLKADRSSGLLEVVGSPTAAKGVATKEYVDNAMPVGTIIAYGGSTIPVGMQATWHLCNGTAHGSAALLSLLGSANTPDLRSRFIVAAGQGTGLSNYAHGSASAGNTESITLTSAQSGVAVHSHGSNVETTASNTNHTHGGGSTGGGGGHQHTYAGGSENNDSYGLVASAYYPGDVLVNLSDRSTYSADGSHGHSVDTSFQQHTHQVTPLPATAASAAQAHENRPPYYALTYIIKKA